MPGGAYSHYTKVEMKGQEARLTASPCLVNQTNRIHKLEVVQYAEM